MWGQTPNPNTYVYGQTPVPNAYGQTPVPQSNLSVPQSQFLHTPVPSMWGQTPAPEAYGQTPINQNTPQQQTAIDQEMALRNDISSGWDQYLSSLDGVVGDLSQQRSSQEGIAQNQFQQGVNTLDLQKGQGLTALGNEETKAKQNQKKTLRDIGTNIQNSLQAGNVYLGTRGAGDSSAADQYSYALTKLGSQRRTDVMNNSANIQQDIDQRRENLSQIYNTERNNLQLQLNSQISQIGQWFAQAQQELKMAKAQGQLSKSQDLASLNKDLLNQALSAVNSVKSQAAQSQSGLDQWANTMSQQLAQTAQKTQTLSNPQYQQDTNSRVAGQPQFTSSGNIYTPGTSGFNTTEDKLKSGFGQYGINWY